jgi:hypothetical protein
MTRGGAQAANGMGREGEDSSNDCDDDDNEDDGGGNVAAKVGKEIASNIKEDPAGALLAERSQKRQRKADLLRSARREAKSASGRNG